MSPALLTRWRLLLPLLAAALSGPAASSSFAYALEGAKWPSSTIVMRLQLTLAPSSPTLIDGRASLNASAADALAEWNPYLERSQFVVDTTTTGTPRDGDNVNSVFSASTVYGDDFGDGTLAVTLLTYDNGVMSEADVLVNTHYRFNSYSGSLRNSGPSGIEDIHRILLHEFGHVLGLDHPDEAGQTVQAIMNSHVSSLDHLVDDDIAGAHFLYDNAPPPDGGGNSPSAFARIRTRKNQISKILYSRATGNLYTLARKKGNGLNRLAVYNPYTLQLIAGPALAQSPDNLAISDDGRYLYYVYTVTAAEPQRIARIDLFTNAVDRDFVAVVPGAAPTSDPFLIPHVIDLQPAPGQPDVLAVCEGYGWRFVNTQQGDEPDKIGTILVAVYDAGIAREKATVFQGTRPGAAVIFTDDPNLLLAAPIAQFAYIYRLSLDATGVSDAGNFSVYIPEIARSYTRYANGLLYPGVGQEYNPVTGEMIRAISPVTATVFSFAIDPVASRGYYFTEAAFALSVYSLPGGELFGSTDLPTSAEGHAIGFNLTPWGTRGLAFGSPSLRGLYVARSITFDGDPATGGSPDTITLDGPAETSISQNAGHALKFRVRSASASTDSSQALTVRYTVSGTGVGGVNFKALRGSVTIPANGTTAKIKFVPRADSLVDSQPVTATISLAADPSYVIAAPATLTLTITP